MKTPHWIPLAACLLAVPLSDACLTPPLPGAAKGLSARAPAAMPTGAANDWSARAYAAIELEEYRASGTSTGFQAPNRAQNLRTYFRERRIEVVAREGDAVLAWRFAWETARFGRPSALQEVATASPEPNGSRVTYRHHEFDELYDNSGEGLEQGFTVHAPPPGDGSLCLVGRLAGSLRAELSAAEGAVDLFDEQGERVLRYGELHVRDSRGDEVPSCLSLAGEELAILVEDADAAYPLTIDPLMTSPAWTAESDQASASFGFSVATAGDVNDDGFSDVVVSAPSYDNGQTDEGRVFVYLGSASGLGLSPAWTAESDQASASFGFSVATAGDVNGDGFSDVVIGAVPLSSRTTYKGS